MAYPPAEKDAEVKGALLFIIIGAVTMLTMSAGFAAIIIALARSAA